MCPSTSACAAPPPAPLAPRASTPTLATSAAASGESWSTVLFIVFRRQCARHCDGLRDRFIPGALPPPGVAAHTAQLPERLGRRHACA